jgi:hypothetical protein
LPDAVYRLEVAGGHLRLVGLKGSTRAGRSIDVHMAQRSSASRAPARFA